MEIYENPSEHYASINYTVPGEGGGQPGPGQYNAAHTRQAHPNYYGGYGEFKLV